MSILNQEELFGKLIPTVYIDRITLESTGENPVKQDNPHIDTGAEGELIEDKFRQKAELTPSYLKSSVELSLKEVLDDDFIGRWFDEEKIRKYIKIWLVQSKDPTVSFVLSENTNAIAISQPTFQWTIENPAVQRLAELWKIRDVNRIRQRFEKNVESQKIDLEFDVEGSPEDLTAKYSELDENGNTIVDVCFRTNFLIREENPAHLSYFVVSYLDIESIREDFDLSFNDSTTTLQNGEVSSEVIIDNNEVAGFSFVLLTPDGRPWAGAVHRRPDGTLATYSTERPISQPLASQRVVNAKIQDFRNIKDIERLQIDLSVIEEELQPITNKLLGLKRDNVVAQKKKTYFSDLYLSRSRAGAAKFAFALDYNKLLKDTSVYKKLFDLASKKSKAELLSFGRIRFMKVVRRRVLEIETKNSLGNPVNGEVLFDQDESYRTIAVASEGQNGTVGTSNTLTGGIRELDVSLESDQQGIRFFTAEDRSMIDVTDGIYQYGVEVEIEDATDKYLNDIASSLRQELSKLNQYYEDGTKLGMTRYILDIQNPHIDSTWERLAIFSSNPGAYEPTSNRFTQAFITQQRNLWENNKENSPWRGPLVAYLQAISVLTPFIQLYDFRKISEDLLKIVAPETGNPRGVLTLISLIDKLATNLESLTSSAGASDRNDSNPKQYSRVGNKPSNRTSKITHWFTEENFDSDVQKNYGYDYLSEVEGDKPEQLQIKAKQLSDPGLRVLAGGEYQRRVEIETLKYFNNLEPELDLKKQNKFITSGDSIGETSFSFLSPSFCYLGDDVRELVRANTDTTTTDQLHEDGYYSTLEAKASLYNTKNAPIPRRQLDEEEELNKNAQEYRDLMLEYFSGLGMRIELADQEEYVARTDSDVAPIRASFVENRERLNLNVGDDNRIDTIEGEKTNPDTRQRQLNRVNPNSMFLGVSKPYIESGYTNESTQPSQKNIVLNKIVKSGADEVSVRTIDTFDLNKRDNFVNRAAQSSEAKNDLAKSLGIENADQETMNEILKKLPNQIKSLLLDSVNSSQIKNNMIGLEYDPVSDVRTSTYFDINYSFINRIEVVTGYVENDMRLKEPIWKPLTLALWNNSVGSALICRMSKFELPIVGIKHPKGINLPVYDIYFVLVPPVLQTLATAVPLAPEEGTEETPMPQTQLMPPKIQVDDDKELIIPEIDDSIESTPKLGVVKNNIVGASPDPVFCLPFRKSVGIK